MHWSALVKLVAVEWVPSSHGSGAEAPSGQYLPGLQGLHAVAFGSSWKDPAEHDEHSPRFPSDCFDPGLHGV